MRTILIIAFLILTNACGKKSDSKSIINSGETSNSGGSSSGGGSSGGNSGGGGEAVDNSTISGVVAQVWSNLMISSANAKELMFVEQKNNKEYLLFSASLLRDDFILQSTSSTMADIITDAFLYADLKVSKFSSLVSSSPFSQLQAYEFSFGVVFGVGFDADNLVKSISVAAVSSNGSYKITDSQEAQIKFYKLSFIFSKNSEIHYRQSYLVTNGGKKTNNVDFMTSVASIQLTEDIILNGVTSFDELKTKLETHQSVIQGKSASALELEAASVYLDAAYGSYMDLTSAQRTIMNSSIMYKMKSDTSLRNAIIVSKETLRNYGSGSLDNLKTSKMMIPDEVINSYDILFHNASFLVKSLGDAGLLTISPKTKDSFLEVIEKEK